MSTDRWMDKKDVVYIYIYYSARKKNDDICSNRNYHTKWSKSERQRQIPCDITCMCNLKYNTDEHIYKNRNRLTDKENKPVVAKERWGELEWGKTGNLGLTDVNYYI